MDLSAEERFRRTLWAPNSGLNNVATLKNFGFLYKWNSWILQISIHNNVNEVALHEQKSTKCTQISEHC